MASQRKLTPVAAYSVTKPAFFHRFRRNCGGEEEESDSEEHHVIEHVKEAVLDHAAAVEDQDADADEGRRARGKRTCCHRQL